MIKDYAADNTELLRRAADGDREARDELIVHNMGLVHSIVKRFLGRGYETEDLIQIGCIGLIRAAERFDLSFDVRFSTYAVPMIIGEIKRFMRDDGLIKVSRNIKEIATKANRMKELIVKETGVEPSVSEVAEKLGIDTAELAAALESQIQPQSLYMTVDDGAGEGRALIEKIESDEDIIGNTVNKITLRQIIGGLCERERKIVYMRYFSRQTQAQVAEKLGISQVQVSRLEKGILAKMKEKIME